MSIIIYIVGLIVLIILATVLAYGIFIIKEYRYSQQTIKNRMRRKEEEAYNIWLFHTGLHETSYYFNPSGIRILSDWQLWKRNNAL